MNYKIRAQKLLTSAMCNRAARYLVDLLNKSPQTQTFLNYLNDTLKQLFHTV